MNADGAGGSLIRTIIFRALDACVAEPNNFTDRGCRRKIYPKVRSISHFTFHGDRSLMKLYDPLRNCQTQTRPAEFPAARLVRAIEPLENSGLILGRNANAGIFYAYHNAAVAFHGGQSHLPGRSSVLEGVVEENIDHTP